MSLWHNWYMIKYVQLDSRNRLSLGSTASAPIYIMTLHEDGSILLEPGQVMPLQEEA